MLVPNLRFHVHVQAELQEKGGAVQRTCCLHTGVASSGSLHLVPGRLLFYPIRQARYLTSSTLLKRNQEQLEDHLFKETPPERLA